MSSLWTPGGEHPVERDRSDTEAGGAPPRGAGRQSGAGSREADDVAIADDAGFADHEQMTPDLEDLRRQLVGTPASVVVANHAYGLFELAAIHLSQQPARLEDARLAIDAMASLVEGLSGRLGEPERSLNDALAQIRLAFVEIGGGAEDEDAADEGATGGGAAPS